MCQSLKIFVFTLELLKIFTVWYLFSLFLWYNCPKTLQTPRPGVSELLSEDVALGLCGLLSSIKDVEKSQEKTCWWYFWVNETAKETFKGVEKWDRMGFQQPWRAEQGGRWQSFGKLQAGETVRNWIQLLGILAGAGSFLKNGKHAFLIDFFTSTSSSSCAIGIVFHWMHWPKVRTFPRWIILNLVIWAFLTVLTLKVYNLVRLAHSVSEIVLLLSITQHFQRNFNNS